MMSEAVDPQLKNKKNLDAATGFKSWEEAVLWLRDQPDQMQLVYDCFYDDPLIGAARRYYHSSEWRALNTILPAIKGKVLDVGAGRGISSFALALDGWQVTALEPDPGNVVGYGAMRLLFEEAGLGVDIVEEWGEKLPFEENVFDLVHVRAALHHANDLKRLCREAARVLKPGGMLIAIREHVVSKPRELPYFLERHPLHHLYGGENAYTLKEYTTAITAGGRMKIEKVLNPLATDINLFPLSREVLKKRIADRLKLPWPGLIPNGLLTMTGHFYNKPGRLYSFVAKKKL